LITHPSLGYIIGFDLPNVPINSDTKANRHGSEQLNAADLDGHILDGNT
jgi:hypothetical protein